MFHTGLCLAFPQESLLLRDYPRVLGGFQEKYGVKKLRALELYSSLKGCTRSKFSQRSLNFVMCISRKVLAWDRNRIFESWVWFFGVFCCCLNGGSFDFIHSNSSVEGFLVLLTEFCQNPDPLRCLVLWRCPGPPCV